MLDIDLYVGAFWEFCRYLVCTLQQFTGHHLQEIQLRSHGWARLDDALDEWAKELTYLPGDEIDVDESEEDRPGPGSPHIWLLDRTFKTQENIAQTKIVFQLEYRAKGAQFQLTLQRKLPELHNRCIFKDSGEPLDTIWGTSLFAWRQGG